MKILYYDWDEFNGADCRDAMIRLGHSVDTFKLKMNSYDLTPEIEAELSGIICENYDLVFSFDFFPNISKVCSKKSISYVSWVFDCPHYTLDCRQISNPVNHVFLFDKKLYESKKNAGIKTVHYSPLGVNEKRLRELCQSIDRQTSGSIFYEHDVCFLGNLYDNEYNFYDQVGYLPPYIKGYADAVIKAQERIFGADFFTMDSIFNFDHVKELREYIKFQQTGKYEIDYDNVIRDILRKKVTVNERHNILGKMGEYFDTVLYTTPGAKEIPGVCNMGMASYDTKMPRVFRRSKVNLNITLRSILSGIPLRVLDVLAAGGFLLTNYQEEIGEYFQDGKDLVIAYTPEDMVEKCAYYLEHEEVRKEIARSGQERVYEAFAYTRLLPDILKI